MFPGRYCSSLAGCLFCAVDGYCCCCFQFACQWRCFCRLQLLAVLQSSESLNFYCFVAAMAACFHLSQQRKERKETEEASGCSTRRNCCFTRLDAVHCWKQREGTIEEKRRGEGGGDSVGREKRWARGRLEREEKKNKKMKKSGFGSFDIKKKGWVNMNN